MYKIFTIESGTVREGATVEKYTLSMGITIPAILVGEEGRGRELGILPVSLLPEQHREWEEKGSVTVYAASVTTTRSGRPKLVAVKEATSDEKVIAVFLTKIGFRGANEHTGDLEGEEFAPFPGEVLVRGVIAQGMAGYMGGGDQFVALIPKGVVFRTAYHGRLYGAPPEHYYLWTGEKLLSATEEEREVADLF